MLSVDSPCSETTAGLPATAPPGALSGIILSLERFFSPRTVAKPGWVHCSNRGWRRHSAYIMSRAGVERAAGRDGSYVAPDMIEKVNEHGKR